MFSTSKIDTVKSIFIKGHLKRPSNTSYVFHSAPRARLQPPQDPPSPHQCVLIVRLSCRDQTPEYIVKPLIKWSLPTARSRLLINNACNTLPHTYLWKNT